MAHVLVVDDEQSICWGLSRLAEQLGHRATTVATAEDGLDFAEQDAPDVVVLDVRLPGMDGLSALSEFHNRFSAVPVIMMTAYGDLDIAVNAIQRGAFDYLPKPFDLDAARNAISRSLQGESDECNTWDDIGDGNPRERIVGSSPVIQRVFKQIALAAQSETSVQVSGETGTGKELVARAIHRHSTRAAAPFVPVNLAEVSIPLAESELFGHTRGAFTGAETDRQGLLEQAHGGTVFLDEVADIPLPLQVKLLRALELGEFRPVGSTRSIHADFRIISASNTDLKQAVAKGRFREDLYFRLAAFEIALPPLRERREDIPALAQHFLALMQSNSPCPHARFSSKTMAALQEHQWRGNVRELRRAIEHALVHARKGEVLPEHLPAETRIEAAPQGCEGELVDLVTRWTSERLQSADSPQRLHDDLVSIVERPLTETVLDTCNGQLITAAKILGIHRTTLRKKVDQFRGPVGKLESG